MKLRLIDKEKADEALRERLENAKAADPMRVVMILEPEASQHSEETKSLKPTQFRNRVEYRKALIAQQQSKLAESVGTTLQQLRDLSLDVSGGEVTRAVVVEGPANLVARGLALPGVRSAVLDAELTLEKPCKPRPPKRVLKKK